MKLGAAVRVKMKSNDKCNLRHEDRTESPEPNCTKFCMISEEREGDAKSSCHLQLFSTLCFECCTKSRKTITSKSANVGAKASLLRSGSYCEPIGKAHTLPLTQTSEHRRPNS